MAFLQSGLYSHLAMLLLSIAVLAGVVAGFAANGFMGRSLVETFDTLRITIKTPRREIWILVMGAFSAALVAVNLLGTSSSFTATNYARYVIAISLVCVAYGAFINRHFTGMSVIALGALLNLIPLLLNGYLPVDPQALIAAGIVDADSLNRVVLGAGRRLQASGDLLPGLGPVIGIGWMREVVSFGDLIIAAGISNVCLRLLWPRDASLRAEIRHDARPAEIAATELAGT